LINVAAGGTLFEDVAEQMPGAIRHDYFPFSEPGFSRDYLAHDVEVTAGSRLARVFGAGALKVNSMHHQGVRDLGEGLAVTATAPDGLIEALEGRGGRYLVGVQWHPEALTDMQDAPKDLFREFVQTASDAS
jgi:putative glutamine amidotransferase